MYPRPPVSGPRLPPPPASDHSPWRLSEPWAAQVFPGQELFHFQFARSSLPRAPKLPPSPRREAPLLPSLGRAQPGPNTHAALSSQGGPVYPLLPGRVCGPYTLPPQAWGHFPKGLRRRVGSVHLCAPPFTVEGAGTGRRDSPLLRPAVPCLLKTELSLAPRILEAASQTRRLSPSLGTQTRCPPGHHQG